MKSPIKAISRILASFADDKQAMQFLSELGFSGLKLKASQNDRIVFSYTNVDRKITDKYVGKEKITPKGFIRWTFGTSGEIVLREQEKLVVLVNSAKNSTRVEPIVTHAPLPKNPPAPIPKSPKVPPLKAPVKAPIKPVPAPAPTPKLPPTPGSRDNDDSKVPVTKISDTLEKMYTYAQASNNAAYYLRFCGALWDYLNGHKFGGHLTKPRIRLLKNVAGASLRRRAQWSPFHREIAVSPRLFNASENFFVEIFLHEMCHQAVSEIDKADNDPGERQQKGHGSFWSAWMRKVGLNPRRFDPNDNTTYMTEKEKIQHQQKKEEFQQKREEVTKKIEDQQMKQVWSPSSGMLVTAKWNNELLHGMLACPTVQNGSKWALLKPTYYRGSSFPIVNHNDLYVYQGPELNPMQLENLRINCKAIAAYYEMKKDRRAVRRSMRSNPFGGFGL